MPSLFLMMDGGNLEHAMCGISVDISGVVWVVFKCDKTSLCVGCCLPSPVRVTMIDDLGTVNGLVRVSNELCLHTPMCAYVHVFVCMYVCVRFYLELTLFVILHSSCAGCLFTLEFVVGG